MNTIHLNEKELPSSDNQKNRQFQMLYDILENSLDELIGSSIADIAHIDGKELGDEIIEEVKLLISILPKDNKGFSVVVGNLFEDTPMCKSFPSVRDVENNHQRYDDIFGDWDGEPNPTFSAVVSIIPNSNPEKAMLFNRQFSNIKESARQILENRMAYNIELIPTKFINNVFDYLYGDFPNNFLASDDKNKIDEIFLLENLPELRSFFKIKKDVYTNDVNTISQWMEINCERLRLSNSIGQREAMDFMNTKETLKV